MDNSFSSSCLKMEVRLQTTILLIKQLSYHHCYVLGRAGILAIPPQPQPLALQARVHLK